MTDAKRRWALAVVCLSVLVTSIDSLILNVALPTLVRELHASTAELQWIVDAYILVFAGSLLVGGSLGDRFGRAKVLRIGLSVFGIASAVAALSESATALVICRGVMGFGAALIMPTSIAVLTNVFTDPRDPARAMGVWSAAAGLGLALGPVLGATRQVAMRVGLVVSATLLGFGAILGLRYLPARALNARDADEARRVPVLDVLVD